MQRVEVPSTSLAADDLPKVRTPETVKAYPLGRYTDPNFPEEMHERHTLYRREQSVVELPAIEALCAATGPVIAQSNPFHPTTRGPTQSRLTRSRRPMPKLCSSRTLRSRSESMSFSRKTPQSRIFQAKSNG